MKTNKEIFVQIKFQICFYILVLFVVVRDNDQLNKKRSESLFFFFSAQKRLLQQQQQQQSVSLTVSSSSSSTETRFDRLPNKEKKKSNKIKKEGKNRQRSLSTFI